MKPDLSWDQKAANAINLVGVSVFAAGIVGMYLYIARTGGHPLRDVSSLLVIAALIWAFNLVARRRRRNDPPEPT